MFRNEFLSILFFVTMFLGGMGVVGLSVVLPFHFLGGWGIPISFVLVCLVVSGMIFGLDY